MPAEIDVLVVDDEPAFLEALEAGLRREGFRVHPAADGVQALEMFESLNPDLVLLDVMLPKMSGLDVCREVRKTSAVPIIMVSAKGSEIDAVLGLEMGADDYVTKPYRLRELVARMRAVLRRQGGGPAELVVEDDQTIEVSGIVLDLGRHEVRVGGAPVHLPLKEFELLEHLMDNAGRVVPRGSLIDVVWGHDYVGDTKTLDVHIKRLRKRLGEQGSNELITTVRGVGYRFERSG
ncbi:MAG: response regulator transcription factor [Acidimicrobiales bacterium]